MNSSDNLRDEVLKRMLKTPPKLFTPKAKKKNDSQESQSKKGKAMSKTEARFDFIKSADCREVPVDGVYGEITPRGQINAVLYKERNHIPASVTHVIGANGAIGEEILEKRELKDGTVRVIETILMLDYDAAVSLREFLAVKIRELDKTRF